MNIMQGDQYSLAIHLKIDNEEIDLTTIEKIQFKIGNLLKTFVKGDEESEVVYDSDNHIFDFPLTEEETFQFSNTTAICEVRVKFVGGIIKGAKIAPVQIDFASIKSRMGD